MTVSRRHAKIDLSGLSSGFATVEDLGSLNGTWVDGAIVNKAMLKDGSTIQIGTFRMVFHTNRKQQRIETGN
jgi:pSer/pThr/pTyr-binding forkhead associated (FHA) protein